MNATALLLVFLLALAQRAQADEILVHFESVEVLR